MRARAKITDEGVAQLQTLVNLRELELDCAFDTEEGTTNTIADAGITYLRALGKLERLVLTQTGVSDASVEALCEMKHLRELFLPRNGKISDESERVLRAALPSSRIVISTSGRPSYMRSTW